MQIKKFIIEGMDRLGKSTLIHELRQKLGYFEIIHYQKPVHLEALNNDLEVYQRRSFENMFALLRSSDANLILDRAHLGEMVYAPIYRGYPGSYVLDLEREYSVDTLTDVRLILLTEDLEIASHFLDDGESLGGIEKRQEEQDLFIRAFTRSIIKDKRIISVTDPALGGFKPKQWILHEALKD